MLFALFWLAPVISIMETLSGKGSFTSPCVLKYRSVSDQTASINCCAFIFLSIIKALAVFRACPEFQALAGVLIMLMRRSAREYKLYSERETIICQHNCKDELIQNCDPECVADL